MSGGGGGVDFQVFSEHLPPTSPICRHLPRFSPHFLLQSHTQHTHTQMHTDAHPVKNNQQPPISFWHAKEGTLKKKKRKKKAQNAAPNCPPYFFKWDIHYASPLPPSSPHLHRSVSTTHSPARSRQLIHWPPSEAALMAGQRMVAKKKLLQECVCMFVCVCVCV